MVRSTHRTDQLKLFAWDNEAVKTHYEAIVQARAGTKQAHLVSGGRGRLSWHSLANPAKCAN